MKFGGFVLSAIAAAVLSCLVVSPFLRPNDPDMRPFALEMEFATDVSGHAQIYFDIGASYNEGDAVRLAVTASPAMATIRFPLPTGTYRALRFDPIDRQANVRFSGARIVHESGRVLHRFSVSDFAPAQQIAQLEPTGEELRVVTSAEANDPILSVAVPIPIKLVDGPVLIKLMSKAAPVFGLACLTLVGIQLLRRRVGDRLTRTLDSVTGWGSRHPACAVALGAAFAAVLSCYPVVFLGKSFVAPSFADGTFLLYEQFPTLPGYNEPDTENAKGSDVGAITWAHQPYSMVQSEALLTHGELPLWNRYNSAGTVLLGQGQTMFGDPFHLPVLLARGAAWAWDLKYLIARWLLCCGLGLAVLHCTRHLPSALLTALSAAFLGFFVYRVNHPAFFSLCYSPWILYGWLRIVDSTTWRQLAVGCGMLLFANLAEMHSGTAKEAYMLLLSLNFVGACTLLAARRSLAERLLRLMAAVWTGVILILLTAPSWLTFVSAMRQSFTSYNSAAAFQILPIFALGFFDEIFYRPLMRDGLVFNPSANFLVLGGLLYTAAAWRHLRRQPHLLALIWGSLPAALLVFGIVPPQWIVRIPFLGNVHHIDNSFSCALIIVGVVVAGYGWHAAFVRLGSRIGARDLKFVALLYLLLAGCWLAATHTVQRPTFGAGSVVSLLTWGKTLPVSAFVWISFVLLPAGLCLFFWSLRRSLRMREMDLAGALFLLAALSAVLWRHGAHTNSVGPADYVFSPGKRPDFHALSPAIEAVEADQSDPARVFGVGGDLFPGWSCAYRLEGISGPDALINPYYRELIGALQLNVIWGWRVYLEPAQIGAARPALDLLNVQHYLDLHSDPAVLGEPLTLVKRADLDVYRSETAWPRAFFTPQIVAYDKPEELATFLRNGPAKPFAAMLRADLADVAIAPVSQPGPADVNPARDYKLTTNTTEFTIDAASTGVAVLHEAWLPDDFRATLNGQDVPVLRVNHAFKGVFIPTAGTHRVSVTYRPHRFSLALALFTTGLVLFGGSIVAVWRTSSRAIALSRKS